MLPSSNPKDLPKTIILVSRKADCDDLARSLHSLGYTVDSLHGDKSQMARDNVMDKFRRGRTRILVATDVAARGLDVKVSQSVIYIVIVRCLLVPM